MKQLLVVIAFGLAWQASAQESNPIHWKAGVARPSGKPGGLMRVEISATVDAGWHLYSLKKIADGPIPTTLTLPAGQPFRLDGKIDAPDPISMDDPTFGITLEFYLGTVPFILPVRVNPDAPPGDRTVRIAARFQACNEKMCLAPKTVTVDVPVTVSRP